MDKTQELINATKDAQFRQLQINANLTAAERLHKRVKDHPRRVLRNRRLLAEAQGLLNANQRLAALNDDVIARNVAYLAR